MFVVPSVTPRGVSFGVIVTLDASDGNGSGWPGSSSAVVRTSLFLRADGADATWAFDPRQYRAKRILRGTLERGEELHSWVRT